MVPLLPDVYRINHLRQASLAAVNEKNTDVYRVIERKKLTP